MRAQVLTLVDERVVEAANWEVLGRELDQNVLAQQLVVESEQEGREDVADSALRIAIEG